MQIKKLLKENEDYLKKAIEQCKRQQEKCKTFYYLGTSYDIITISTKEIEIIGNIIYVKNRDYLNRWLRQQTSQIFQEHLDTIYHQFEESIPYPQLKIRKMKTRWGVCNKKTKTITLNSELIRYRIDQLEYVIIHELSHFVHFNHSHSFWELVHKYCPNYKTIRKELKD